MMAVRAHVPSRALLRALCRPSPTPLPIARQPLPRLVRCKRTKAAKANPPSPALPEGWTMDRIKALITTMDSPEALDKLPQKELTEEELSRNEGFADISWYEQDLAKGTPPRLVSRHATPEDRLRDKKTHDMILEAQKNPDYDDAILNRRLIDTLLEHPSFEDMAEELNDLKQEQRTREEQAAFDKSNKEAADQELADFDAGVKSTMHDALQELIDDPDIGGAAREELRAVQAKLPSIDDMENPEFHAALENAMSKLEGNQAFQRKMAAADDEGLDNDWQKFEKDVNDAVRLNEDDDADLRPPTIDDLRDLDWHYDQINDGYREIATEFGLEAEIDYLLKEMEKEDFGGSKSSTSDMSDAEKLTKALEKLTPPKTSSSSQPQTDDENLSPELQAKVDKIMADPKLMEKLVHIQKLIAEAESMNTDLTTIAHETAPDPYELEESRTTTIRSRVEAARKDPEHKAALDNLRVHLPAPFNISPVLHSFNQALELAYIGANDDVRRVLWRCYQKARSLPTFLETLSDDAWDILYYSQAVTWGSNQNRQDHLRLLLKDLKSVGRDGPPTHPGSIGNPDEEESVQG
ncbi:hypothetical protein IQ07DRAFT_503427 [Pyrenochaeta sp. DS3sAY3a]|nr:hypothetical protein IQ07DRAFT_503427 [Pyrenochaeta sp. DS3sAY3a]